MGQSKRDAWVRRIASEDGPASPTTRLVLLVLASHMSLDGGSCFPSVRTLIRETGLSNRSVLDHLKLAADAGWIERIESGTGQGWKRHAYQAEVPARFKVERGEGRSPRSAEGGEPHDTNVVKEVHHSTSYNQSSLSQTKQRGEGASPPSRKAPTAEFERAWPGYPRRAGGNSKKAARRCWQARVRRGASEDGMVQGVVRYARFCDATGKTGTEYVMQASRFFGPDEYWREDWPVPSKNGGAPEPALANLQALS